MKSYIDKMAETIINYSTAVQPGDKVLLRGTSPAAEPLIQAMYQAALQAGGEAFVYIHPSNEDALALSATDNLDLLAVPNPMLLMMYENCDVIVRVEASENTKALSSYPVQAQQARAKAYGEVLKIQMRREGSGELRRCTTQVSTQAYAQAAGMSLQQYSEFIFKACKLHLDDPVAAWKELEVAQQKLVDYLVGKNQIEVHGPNADLTLSIAGRAFINANGKANFPDGEIFTGPVEDSVNGWVLFTYPAYFQGNEVLGAKLYFEDGQVVKATASKNEAFLQSVLETDEGAKRLGEFAIGTNADIQQFTGSILFDEKIGGSIHMALGQSYAQTGGKNASAIHWDLICDMREGGEILVDSELFYQNGQFLI